MGRKSKQAMVCPNAACEPHGIRDRGNIALRKLSVREVFTARVAPVWFVLAASRGSAYHRGEEKPKLAA
jgi:hypothetical protein